MLKNGGDSLALTDHGNMNGFSHQYLHGEKLKKAGIPFKPIHGLEAYFIPSIPKWKALYDANKAEKASAPKKVRGKIPAATEELVEAGNDMFSTEVELAEIGEAKVEAEESLNLEDDSGGTIIENEEESKSVASKFRNPLYQKNHLVLLAKNDAGLKALFRIVSDSAADGFYVKPRVDLDMLRKHAGGNIIATTACIAGYPAKIIFDNQVESGHTLWVPNQDNVEKIQRELASMISEFQEALGPENYYLELQFNKLGCIAGDAKIETTSGISELSDVVKRVQLGEAIKVPSLNISTGIIEEKSVTSGQLTHKKAKLMKITLADGKTLKLTPNHKVFTDQGWKEARELKECPGIRILTVSRISSQ